MWSRKSWEDFEKCRSRHQIRASIKSGRERFPMQTSQDRGKRGLSGRRSTL